MKLIFLSSVILMLCFSSCKDNAEEKAVFDKELWKEKNIKGDYSFRDEMLEDLVYNVPLKGLPKEEVITMLGSPDWTNKDYLYYEAPPKHAGFFPFQKRYLVLKFKKDNTVEWRKIKN